MMELCASKPSATMFARISAMALKKTLYVLEHNGRFYIADALSSEKKLVSTHDPK